MAQKSEDLIYIVTEALNDARYDVHFHIFQQQDGHSQHVTTYEKCIGIHIQGLSECIYVCGVCTVTVCSV